MSKLENRKILIVNNSPIQARDLKNYLEIQKEAQVYIAEDLKSSLKMIRDNDIEVVMAEFTMPKNFKFKINRYCKRIEKEPPHYLSVNTRIIISKAKNADDASNVLVLKDVVESSEEFFTSRSIDDFFDVSQRVSELYSKPLSLKITNIDKAQDAEFLELVEDGIICSVPDKLIMFQVCEFVISNFLDIEEELRFNGVVKESNKDDEENFYITYVQLDKSSQGTWNKILEKLAKKQKEASEFLKAANE